MHAPLRLLTTRALLQAPCLAVRTHRSSYLYNHTILPFGATGLRPAPLHRQQPSPSVLSDAERDGKQRHPSRRTAQSEPSHALRREYPSIPRPSVRGVIFIKTHKTGGSTVAGHTTAHIPTFSATSRPPKSSNLHTFEPHAFKLVQRCCSGWRSIAIFPCCSRAPTLELATYQQPLASLRRRDPWRRGVFTSSPLLAGSTGDTSATQTHSERCAVHSNCVETYVNT